MSKMTIVRYGQPTKLDSAEYGSQCIVKYHGSDNYDLYLQTNKSEDNAQWELIGSFTPTVPQEYIDQLIHMRLGKGHNQYEI